MYEMTKQEIAYKNIKEAAAQFAAKIVEHGEYRFTAYFDTTIAADTAYEVMENISPRFGSKWADEYEAEIYVS